MIGEWWVLPLLVVPFVAAGLVAEGFRLPSEATSAARRLTIRTGAALRRIAQRRDGMRRLYKLRQVGPFLEDRNHGHVMAGDACEAANSIGGTVVQKDVMQVTVVATGERLTLQYGGHERGWVLA